MKKRPVLTPQPFPPAPENNEYVFTLDMDLDNMDDIINIPSLSLGGPNSARSSSVSGHNTHIPGGFGGHTSHADFISTLVPAKGCSDQGSSNWTPPESWVVEGDGEDTDIEGGSSSSDESTVEGKQGARSRHMTIRVYLLDGTYHIMRAPTNASVAVLTDVLSERLLQTEPHRLYLKEAGRERILSRMERPRTIMKQRLALGGYDFIDGEELFADDMSSLFKFVYRSQLLGPAEEMPTIEDFSYINLAGHGLLTIPIVLHQHAASIVSLKLSRNPMNEIPLDFIQACTGLKELRLSDMAMKRVPRSVHHSSSLSRLDLSSNHIAELDDAHLNTITGLSALFVQNNRIKKLPPYMSRFSSLTTLVISNNNFNTFPTIVCSIESLRNLDLSFNMISELPQKLSKLKGLWRLVIAGNLVTGFPDECSGLISLRMLDCRRNSIRNLNCIARLPHLESLNTDHNALHALDLSVGPCLSTLDVSHNDLAGLSLTPGPTGDGPYALTFLDISHGRLTSLCDISLDRLHSLQHLRLDHNMLHAVPQSLCDLAYLQTLTCSNNKLCSLPTNIGRLQRLEVLDAHNNNLTDIPQTLWNCASLSVINLTSNFLEVWPDTPQAPSIEPNRDDAGIASLPLGSGRALPPLVCSLEKLYLGGNRLTDDALCLLMNFQEIRLLNLSYNGFRDMPSNFFARLPFIEELYLSGNKLADIPTEDLFRLTKLSVLYLNGNRFRTLPQELGKVTSLTVFDASSNLLRYNINNWEFDWNWNFNKNLTYLNLSGNDKLQIICKSNHQRPSNWNLKHSLADFTELTRLRVLGLMDVTTNFDHSSCIPKDGDNCRVRASGPTVCRMVYGISDTPGKDGYLGTLDLFEERQSSKYEAILGMFSRAQPRKPYPPGVNPNRLVRFLRDHFPGVFNEQLAKLSPSRPHLGGIPDALRRTFLKLNQDLHASLSTPNKFVGGAPPDPTLLSSGASGIVLYFTQKTLYAANVGDTLAVVSRQGKAQLVSRKHDPYDSPELARIRAAEGWISLPGLVNDEAELSRAFGFYHLLPTINARPDIITYDLTPEDDFVIVANKVLWDYVSYQTAVDIARAQKADRMMAAQRLRDLVVGYGAQEGVMIMVVGLNDVT